MMGEHNSPAYRDGIADHERRNELLIHCPSVDLDLCDPSKWGGPWMYLRGWESVQDAAPHSCDQCNRNLATISTTGGPAADVSGSHDSWA